MATCLEACKMLYSKDELDETLAPSRKVSDKFGDDNEEPASNLLTQKSSYDKEVRQVEHQWINKYSLDSIS